MSIDRLAPPQGICGEDLIAKVRGERIPEHSIKIESDGRIARLYLDGQDISRDIYEYTITQKGGERPVIHLTLERPVVKFNGRGIVITDKEKTPFVEVESEA